MHLIKNKDNLMFARPIKLDRKLGVIYQPQLKDLVDNNIKIEELWSPFVVDDFISFNQGKFKTLIDLHMARENKDFIPNLIKSLKILYKTENVKLKIFERKIVINDDLILDNENYDYLCEVVADIFMLDLKDIQSKYDEIRKKNDKPKTERDKRIEEAKARSRKYRQDDYFGLTDMVNYLIHSTEKYTYENILNMTVWQIKNSFNLYQKKEMYDIDKRYQTSGNFDMGKEKMKHWFFKN